MNLDSTVFALRDPEAVAAYTAHCRLERDLLNMAVEESKERWQRLPMIARGRQKNSVLGLAVRPEDWTWAGARERYKAEQEAKGDTASYWGFDADRYDPVVIPEGWRKRVKDDYLSPPLKGSSDAILVARNYCHRWSQVETARGYLERVHGAPTNHFAGLRFITIGAAVYDDVLYVISGKGYEIEDKRFEPVKLSEYLAVLEAHPKDDDEENDDE